MVNWKARAVSLAAAITLVAGVAVASGYFTAGLPAAVPPLTGSELIPADTQLAGGAPPQSESISVAQIATYANSTAQNNVVGVGAGYKVARGVTSVTGTADVTTGLATVVACADNLAADSSLNDLFVSISIPTQSGGTAGHVTIKNWKPTASGDVTPIASTTATSNSWICVGT